MPNIFTFTLRIVIIIFLLVTSSSILAQFKDLPPVADAHVQSGNTAANAGTLDRVFIQSSTTAASSFGDERAWFRFDLNGQIPPGATITSAKLRLFEYSRFSDTADNVDLAAEVAGSTDDSWVETSISWSNQPSFGSALSSATFAANVDDVWYEFDVTSFVQQEFSGINPDGIVSLVVKPTTEGNSSTITYQFDSRERIVEGYSLLPRLRIEYTGSWPSANSVNFIHTNDIHSRLTTHDFDFPDADGEMPALEEAGGAALLGAKVVELKKANPDSIYIDAGDISEGNPLGDLRGNGGTVDFFQQLNSELKGLANNSSGRGVDAIVVGNHDVREEAMLMNMADPNGNGVMNGPDTSNNAVINDPDDVPYLAVNILNEGESKPAPAEWPMEMPYRPYIVIDVNGTRVGVLGYLTDDSAILTAETVNEIDVLETVWKDKGNGVDTTNVVLLEDWVNHIRTVENADMVVLLSHIGHRRLNSDGDVGDGDGNDELIGDQGMVAPPDLVVSGHWHTMTDTAWQPSNLNYKTTNVEAASYSQYVGEITLTDEGRYLSATKHPIRVSDFTIPFADSEVDTAYDNIVSLLSTLDTEYSALTSPDCVIDATTVQSQIPTYIDGSPCPLDYIVGYLGVDLTLDKDKWFTISEFPWSGDNTAGAWITDAMVDKVRSLNINGGGVSVSNAHLAIQSGGGIRRDIAAGEVSYREIFEAYPWDDDSMVRVQMTSADIWTYIQGRFVGSSISEDWQVTAEDGIVTDISYDSNQDGTFDTVLVSTDDTTTWNVIISEFMYENDSWINDTGGFNNTFTTLDPNPEYIATDGSTSSTPIASGAIPAPLPIRDSVVEYTANSTALNPIQVAGPRYLLNTETAGEFEVVVTMLNDAQNQPFFEGVFVRLINASAETITRRNLPGDPYGLTSLINADGSINKNHEFSETLLYRSHLGFPDGYLQVGDRLMVRGEFGFFEGNAQFVDQEGIVSAESEFEMLLPANPSLALPNYQQTTSDIMVEAQENRLVKFYAQRTSDSTVSDAVGTNLQLYREDAFETNVFLPGANGDCLELIGVQTESEFNGQIRRFRLRDVTADPFGGNVCFPPSSILSVTGSGPFEVGNPITLTASTSDLNGFTQGSGSYFAVMDLDGEGGPAEVTMNFDNIDITGATNLVFSSLIAEDDDGTNEDWDGQLGGDDNFVHIDYRINSDSGPYQNLLHIENDGSNFNSAPFIDTNFDGIGDGAEITSTFTEFNAAISGTGSTLDLRITFNLEDGDEDIALDNIRILDGQNNALLFENFEDATVEYTTSVAEFSDGFFDFFTRTDGSNINSQVIYDGLPGSMQLVGNVVSVEFFVSLDGGLTFISAGIDSDASNGFSTDYTPTSAGNLQFYTVATDDDGLVEYSPIFADTSILVEESSVSGPIPVNVPLAPKFVYFIFTIFILMYAGYYIRCNYIKDKVTQRYN